MLPVLLLFSFPTKRHAVSEWFMSDSCSSSNGHKQIAVKKYEQTMHTQYFQNSLSLQIFSVFQYFQRICWTASGFYIISSFEWHYLYRLLISRTPSDNKFHKSSIFFFKNIRATNLIEAQFFLLEVEKK